MKKIIFIVLIPIFFLAACSITSKISNRNIADIYHNETTFLHPQYVVYHASDSVSELYFKVKTSELLYAREIGNPMSTYESRIKISYQLLTGYSSKVIIDSSSILISDSIKNTEIIGHLAIKIPFGKNYILQIELSDLNKHTSLTSFVDVYKMNHFNEQNFLVCEKNTEIPLFRNYLQNNESITIETNHADCKTIYARYYNRDFPIAAPPYAVVMEKPFRYEADSSFAIQQNNNGSFSFTATKFTNGFYNFLIDTTKKFGLTLFEFGNDFPQLTTINKLLEPLRYICTKEEYKELSTEKDTKKAVDSFWLQLAGNKDRAKEIISKYYNRVQDANEFFTSYLEGWKTDRGMIYILYGQPNVVYRTENTENWVYGEENNLMSLTFSFAKITNPFSQNDFKLDRSSVYKNTWFNTVDFWREGRVYLGN